MMKILRFGLRFWITLTSMASFMVGWVMLVHAPKPIQSSQTVTQSLPTLEPLPPLDQFNSSNDIQQPQTFSLPRRNRFSLFPMFRTGGS